MPVAGAVIGAGASLIGGSIAAKGQKKAAQAQAQAAADANATQRYVFDTQRQDSMPWHDAGVTGLNNLLSASQPGNAMNWLSQQPGYQFQLQQGLDAVTSNRAAGGLLGSGGTLKALQDRGTGLAGTYFNNYWNQQAGLAGVGQTANTQMGQAGQNYANQTGQNAMNAGAARASAYQNNSAGWGNALGQLGGIAANYANNRAPAWQPQPALGPEWDGLL